MYTKVSNKLVSANSADLDQIAPISLKYFKKNNYIKAKFMQNMLNKVFEI